MNNGQCIPDTWYYTRSCAMRVLVRVRLAPFIRALALWRGAYLHAVAVMSTLFTCDATHCCTPFPGIVRMLAYAYQQMHSLHAYCDSYTSTKHLLVVCTFFNFVAMKIKIEIEIEIASFCQDCRKDQALLPFVGRSFERIDRHFFSGGSLHHCHAAYKYEFR